MRENTIWFGNYYQQGGEKKTPIEWLVLEESGGKQLLLSKLCLDCKPFHHTECDITWATCSLREWLNLDFLDAAFTPAEQRKILDADVPADTNPEHVTPPGDRTVDQVFLLSAKEAARYLPAPEARLAPATAFARAQGVYATVPEKPVFWWLRSPGYFPSCAAGVMANGWISYDGDTVYRKLNTNAVRPAIWVEL